MYEERILWTIGDYCGEPGDSLRDDYHRIYSHPVLGREVICYTVDIIQTSRGRFPDSTRPH
jgi:hypothetical protein